MRLLSVSAVAATFMVLTGCVSTGDTVEFPLLDAWYEGRKVHYITTDVSDREMARVMGANYAPRLRQAIPRYPKPPHIKTILERVYGFPGGEQANSVFASIPEPLGFSSEDGIYSPIWLMYMVEWQDGVAVTTLRSEEEILAAEEKGWVTVTRTDVVINCPVVGLDDGSRLPVSGL